MTCKWYNFCPLRRFERAGLLDGRWAEAYCQSTNGWRDCKRYQFEEKGVYHPDNLLPDGRIDKSLRPD